MAIGDLKQFHIEAVLHAKNLKKLLNQGKELRDFWDKTDCLNNADAVGAPVVKNDLINYATLLEKLKDFADNVAVSAGDRRAVIERVATTPVSKSYL